MRTDQIKYSLKVELAGFADFRYKAKKKKSSSHDDTKLFGLGNWKHEKLSFCNTKHCERSRFE